MKNIILFLLILSNTLVYSQSASQIFDCKEIVFFGLDFSKAAMVGSDDFKSGEEIKSKYFDAWNNVVFNERSKYNIAETFGKESILYDFTIVKKRNSSTDPAKIVSDITPQLNQDVIQKIISGYNTENYNKGIGLAFIIESFNKPDEKGNFFVVFFDIESKKVLLCERLSEKPGGFGLKNYWIRSIYNALDEIEDDLWDEWKTKYNN